MRDADKNVEQLINELSQLRARIAELEASETERVRAEEELQVSEARYRTLVDNANEIVVVVQDGICKFGNPKTFEVTGYSLEELTSEPFLKFIHPDDRQRASENYALRLRGEGSIPVSPTRILTKYGDVKWIEFSWSNITWEGRPALLYLINDITDLKKIEESLAESEAKYKDLAESITDVFFAMDEDLRYTYWNKASEELTGISTVDALGKHLIDIFPDSEATRKAENAYRRALTTKKPQHFMGDFTIGGRDFVFEINAYPTASGLCVYGRDVTASKKLEEALRESEQWYRLIIDNTPMGIGFATIDGKVITINKAMETITGYTVEDLNKINLVDMYVEGVDRDNFLRELSGRGSVIDYPLQLRRKDGTKYDALLTSKLTTIGDKEFIQTILLDVTERKRAEEALRESEERYRSLVELSPEAIFAAIEGKHVFMNSAGLKLLGASSPEEIIGKPVMDIIAPDYREFVAERMRAVLETGRVAPTMEEKFIRLDGKEIDVEVRASPLIYEGKPAIQAVIRDITERKQAEEGYRTIIRTAMDGFWITDMHGHFLDANAAYCNLIGYRRGELLNMSIADIEAIEKPEEVAGRISKVLQIGRDRFETQHRRKNGEIIDVEISVNYLPAGSGRMVVFVRDVTERKQAEKQLQQEKDRAQRYLDIAGVMFVANDADGRVTLINKRGCEILGYKPEELIGKNWFDIIIPERTRGEVKAVFNKLITGEALPVEYFENPVLNRSGEERIIAWHNVILKDGAGNIIGTLSSGEDVTERKKAEEAVRTSEERYRLLAENIRDVIWSADMNLRFTYVSPSVKYLGGRTAEEVMSMSLEQLLTPSSQELAMKAFQEELLMAEVTPVDPTRSRVLEVEFVRADGSILWAELKMNFVRGSDGRPAGILGVMRDITERRRAEEERVVLEQKAQLASRLASVGELAAGVAHEINNPLTGVIGYAELLMQEDVPEHIKDDLEIIHDGAQRVAGVVKGLLKFARQTRPERIPVDINEIIQVTLRLRAYEMQTNSIKVVTNLASELPLTVADPGQLQQVFLNLTVNAETEMKLAHGKGKLSIRTEQIDDIIRISFKDDGPGIARKNLERIFDPFFTTREVGKGTGLGLSICHGIISQHGGKIYAESRQGKGATFVVELPVVAEKKRAAKRLGLSHKPKSTNRARILVVDDEPVVGQLLSHILEGEGYKVEVTEDGKDALDRINKKTYNLILLDIKLPGLSGSELYERIRGISQFLAKRVVFITGDVMAADTEAFLARTKVRFVTKPFNVNQLKQEIDRCLATSSSEKSAKPKPRVKNRKPRVKN
jgi:PAS domain S-box-containing protein